MPGTEPALFGTRCSLEPATGSAGVLRSSLSVSTDLPAPARVLALGPNDASSATMCDTDSAVRRRHGHDLAAFDGVLSRSIQARTPDSCVRAWSLSPTVQRTVSRAGEYLHGSGVGEGEGPCAGIASAWIAHRPIMMPGAASALAPVLVGTVLDPSDLESGALPPKPHLGSVVPAGVPPRRPSVRASGTSCHSASAVVPLPAAARLPGKVQATVPGLVLGRGQGAPAQALAEDPEGASRQVPVEGDVTGLRALYADDEAVNRTVGARMLARLGCEAVVVKVSWRWCTARAVCETSGAFRSPSGLGFTIRPCGLGTVSLGCMSIIRNRGRGRGRG